MHRLKYTIGSSVVAIILIIPLFIGCGSDSTNKKDNLTISGQTSEQQLKTYFEDDEIEIFKEVGNKIFVLQRYERGGDQDG